VGDIADDGGRYEDLGAPVHWIKGNNENFDLIASGDLPPGLLYLPNGTSRRIGVLTVAGLGGTFAPTMYELGPEELPHPKKGTAKATELADRRRHFVREEVEALKRLRNVDVLMTHEAPRPYVVGGAGARRGIDAGKTPVNEILAEISRDPFALGDDAAQYLAARMRRFGIADAGFDHRLFVERLIVPSYQQAITRALLRSNVPLLLFGENWGGIEEFSPHAGGPVRSRRDLRRATRGVRGLVHVWPAPHAHPIDALGLPVLRRGNESLRSFIELARRPLPQGWSHELPPLRAEALLDLIRRG